MLLSSILVAAALSACANAVNITVSSSGGNKTSTTQYGLMFEDLNHCGDGGLYAELVQNRAFQQGNLDAWMPLNGANLTLKNLSQPLSSALPQSMNVAVSKAGGQVGFENYGYWGMSIKPQKYAGSFYVKGSYSGQFTAAIASNLTSDVFGSVKIPSKSSKDAWVQYNFTITPTKAAPDTNNTLRITFNAAGAKDGSLDFNLISLFPPTYNNRPNGMRPDLVEALKETNPKFFRFPGGSDLEGTSVGTQYIWNNTIGPLKERPGRPSIWGYQETGGQGLVEYMDFMTDLNLEPVLAVWSGERLDGTITPEDQLQPYVQQALDELEFLTGPTTSIFGKLRAQLGYPKPWTVNYVEIGNEDNLNGGLPSYQQYRFKMFYDAIAKAYPHVTVMASTPNVTLPAGASSDYHQYTTPDGFVSQFNWFDQNPVGSKTLIGEVATVWPNDGDAGVPWGGPKFPMYPWWIGSVAESIFLIGAERNSDRVIGAAYAPTFMNVNSWEWSPTMIAFDADPSRTTRSTSHHVFRLLATNTITRTLPSKSSGNFGPLFYVAGVNEDEGTHLFKAAVYNSTAELPVKVKFDGVAAKTSATLTVLSSSDPYNWNVIGGPNMVNETVIAVTSDDTGAFSFKLPVHSVAVLKTSGGRSKRQWIG